MKLVDGRVGRFVKTARTLLIVQLAAALLAAGLSIWAFVEVREMAAERDRLQERVAELERDQAAKDALSTGLPADAMPAVNGVAPEIPFAIPVPVPMTDPLTTPVEPVMPVEPAAGPPVEPPASGPDCSGANAALPRCRPSGRWNPPPRPSTEVPVRPSPDTNQQRPPAPN
jgi:hypothetical protein